ncbi:hypothetical protein [Ferruginibacter albus]|uniref:hypothetical protein n=1 Tax=Ferruginibacter albus TaxID=2875540 RepID=UPI001CC3AA8D|nr:hypothetical protein [Ferruginibacter albus]UAY53133.1 hypothetical protein K9M53_05520 [Ferruginibacter albus]
MKTMLLSIFLLCSINSFSQKITYHYLAGTWEIVGCEKSNGAARPVLVATFIDSSTMYFKFITNKWGDSLFMYYKIDTLTNPVSINTRLTDKQFEKDVRIFLNPIDNNVIQFQGYPFGNHKTKQWEPNSERGLFIRRN